MAIFQVKRGSVRRNNNVEMTRFDSAAITGTARLSGSNPLLNAKIISKNAMDWTIKKPIILTRSEMPSTRPICWKSPANIEPKIP